MLHPSTLNRQQRHCRRVSQLCNSYRLNDTNINAGGAAMHCCTYHIVVPISFPTWFVKTVCEDRLDSAKSNTQMSRGVTERRDIKDSGFVFYIYIYRKQHTEGSFFFKKKKKGLYIVMISRFLEFLWDWKPVFFVCTKKTQSCH